MIRDRLHNFIDWLHKNSPNITNISLVVLAIVDISKLDEYTHPLFNITNFPIGKIIYYISVVMAILFGIWGYENAKSIAKMESDNREKANKINDLESGLNDSIKAMDELFNSYLALIFKNMNFTHTERISVYKVFQNKFVLIGRASDNPKLQKNGRSSYPVDEGFIGKGWEENEFFINSLPDPNGRTRESYFNQICANCNIEKSTLQSIRMKSRTFLVKRINGFDSQAKAVIVLESLKAAGFEKDEISQKLENVKLPLMMFVEKNNGINLLPTNDLGL